MGNQIPDIAVLLTCYNRKEKTLNSLKALYAQDQVGELFSLHVFLVDDGSTDGTAESVSQAFPSVVIIKGTGSLYWNRGMHLAWTKAAEQKDFDFYFWLNDDTILLKHAITTMLNCHKMATSESIVCGSTFSAETKERTYGGSTLKGVDLVPDGTIQECRIMNGNCVLISRKIFKTVGFIDNIFPHAIGDFDYGLRAYKKGIKIVIPGEYVATCEQHERLPDWCLVEIPFKKRIKSLYSPLGYSHPYYFFIYEKRHSGIWVAIKHYFSIHLRVLMPSLWK